jgi:hypothetical protein
MFELDLKHYEQTGAIDVIDGDMRVATAYSLVDAVDIATLLSQQKRIGRLDHKNKVINDLLDQSDLMSLKFPREILYILLAKAYEEGRLSDAHYTDKVEHKISGAV